MKNNLQLHQTYKQSLILSKSMKNHLEFLKMNNHELSSFLKEVSLTNPFLEYTPSTDISLYLNEGIESKKSLKDELYFQLHTCNQDYNQKNAEYIIESLDENGFFNQDFDDIDTLSLIQSFEPYGVAAKNSLDSIFIQLKQKQQFLALQIMKEFEKEIIHNDLDTISKELKISFDQVYECIHQIQQCSPFPCANYSVDIQPQIIPDLEIIIEENEIHIHPKEIGNIYLEETSLSRNMNKEVKRYFQEAKFYIDSIHKRNKTLLLMMNELGKIQEGFFLYHDQLNPCTLNEIALLTNYSKSTTSRTLSNKYFLFQDTIYPIYSLFTSKTKEGSSKDSILNAIQYLIETEDKNYPLEDEQIVERLKEFELYAARRTISKYRNQLNIKNSRQRKKDYKKG